VSEKKGKFHVADCFVSVVGFVISCRYVDELEATHLEVKVENNSRIMISFDSWTLM